MVLEVLESGRLKYNSKFAGCGNYYLININ